MKSKNTVNETNTVVYISLSMFHRYCYSYLHILGSCLHKPSGSVIAWITIIYVCVCMCARACVCLCHKDGWRAACRVLSVGVGLQAPVWTQPPLPHSGEIGEMSPQLRFVIFTNPLTLCCLELGLLRLTLITSDKTMRRDENNCRGTSEINGGHASDMEVRCEPIRRQSGEETEGLHHSCVYNIHQLSSWCQWICLVLFPHCTYTTAERGVCLDVCVCVCYCTSYTNKLIV